MMMRLNMATSCLVSSKWVQMPHTFNGTLVLAFVTLFALLMCSALITDAANCGTGWPIQHYDTADQPGYTFAAPDKQFSCTGQVKAWRYQIITPAAFRVIVWRPVSGTQFKIVGINDIPAGVANAPVTFDVPENERIGVKPGDVIGWAAGTGVISKVLSGTSTVRWIGGNLHSTLQVDQVHDFAGNGLRKYAIEAVTETGNEGQWFQSDNDDKCLQNHDIVTEQTSGLGKCIFKCITREECLSVNFQGTSCNLKSANKQTAPSGDLTTNSGCKYFYLM